jgi:hypothetical protein
MFGSYLILENFDYKIGNNFKFSGSLLKPEDRNQRNNMKNEDIVLAVIIVKTLLVIYYIIVTNNCQ